MRNFFLQIKWVIIYWLCWVLLFQAARILFLLFHKAEFASDFIQQALLSMLYGLRMDASMAAYFCLPLCIVLLISLWYSKIHVKSLIIIYSWIILFPVLLIIFCDIPAYKAWGFRLDLTPLRYLASPKEAWASVSHLPLFWIFLGFIIIYIITGLFFQILISRFIPSLEKSGNALYQSIGLLVLTAVFVVTIRGGWQLAALNQSSVYFSDQNIANQAAINATWNFLHSATHQGGARENPYIYLNKNLADSLFRVATPDPFISSQNTDSLAIKPNIILIIWESLTQKAVQKTWNGVEVTPGFNKLIQEGIYFSNAYASGDRTDKGLVSILSGYPAQPITSIVKIPRKANSLPNIAREFGKGSYHTVFAYGGELEFANMKAYVAGSGFDQIISVDQFEDEDLDFKWGAHDHMVASYLQKEMHQIRQPFFLSWLTLSSHEPFETPVPKVIPGIQETDLFLNSIHYSDSCVFEFVQFIKKQSWWNNTIIAIVADHGRRTPVTDSRLDDFKIPVLLIDGRVKYAPEIINRPVSQLDLGLTLLQEAGLPSDMFVWSEHLLTKEKKRSPYFSFNNGFGLVGKEGYFIYDHGGKQIVEKRGKLSEQFIQTGKAWLQLSYQDYLDR